MKVYYDDVGDRFLVDPPFTDMLAEVSASYDGTYTEYYRNLVDSTIKCNFRYSAIERYCSLIPISEQREIFFKSNHFESELAHMYRYVIPNRELYKLLSDDIGEAVYVINATADEVEKLCYGGIRKWISNVEVTCPAKAVVINENKIKALAIISYCDPVKVLDSGSILDYHFYSLTSSNKSYDQIVESVGKGNTAFAWNIEVVVSVESL